MCSQDIGFDDILSQGNFRKRPRVGRTHTYVGRFMEAGNGANGLMLHTFRDNKKAGWMREGEELERIKRIVETAAKGGYEVDVRVTCTWNRRFRWYGATCWEGSCIWKAYVKTREMFGYNTDITTADEFSDSYSDWSDM